MKNNIVNNKDKFVIYEDNAMKILGVLDGLMVFIDLNTKHSIILIIEIKKKHCTINYS
ncbi:MAG: hypothetical protein FWH29_04910 [Methanobrevibacter sp.]|nr:hypothetical protein [Methanobrevibacter sp.]